jgi:hypothetical protein
LIVYFSSSPFGLDGALFDVHDVSCPSHEGAVVEHDQRVVGWRGLTVHRISVRPTSVQELVWTLFDPAELGYDAERDWEQFTADLRLNPCVRLPYTTP